MVIGLSRITAKNILCEPCIMGKQHKKPFPKKKTWRMKEKLRLVHSNICGLMLTVLLGGAKYFLTFIDDLLRKVWVYPIKEKL